MEYLPPASFRMAGWMTLFEYQQKHGLAPYKANIRAALDQVLQALWRLGIGSMETSDHRIY